MRLTYFAGFAIAVIPACGGSPTKDPDLSGSNAKSIGPSYEHCDKVIEESIFNRIIHNQATYEQEVLKRRFLSYSEDQAYDRYSHNYDEYRRSGGGGRVNIFGYGSGAGEYGAENKLSQAEHSEQFRNFRTANQGSLDWSSESSFVSNYVSYIRDESTIRAWQACIEAEPRTQLTCYGYRDPSGDAFVHVQWVPGSPEMTVSVPSVTLSFSTHEGTSVHTSDLDLFRGSGLGYAVTVPDGPDAHFLFTNSRAVDRSGNPVGNYTCRAVIPPKELAPLEPLSLTDDDKKCVKARQLALGRGEWTYWDYQFYERLNWAPVYRERFNPASGIGAIAPCADAAAGLSEELP